VHVGDRDHSMRFEIFYFSFLVDKTCSEFESPESKIF